MNGSPFIAYFDLTGADQASEDVAIELLRTMIWQLRGVQHAQPPAGRVVRGPEFTYEANTDLFATRRGTGPLLIAWDTNLLLHYFSHGAAIWSGEAMSSSAGLPGTDEETALELEALQVLIALWLVRDIEFHLMPKTLTDSKRKALTKGQSQRRSRAWDEFVGAISLGRGFDDSDALEPLVFPTSYVESVLESVPEGNDRVLVRQAVGQGMHVFLTCDKRVLKTRARLHHLGLVVLSPQDLVGELAAAGALDCLLDPASLYWPLQDLHRATRLRRALLPPVGRN